MKPLDIGADGSLNEGSRSPEKAGFEGNHKLRNGGPPNTTRRGSLEIECEGFSSGCSDDDKQLSSDQTDVESEPAVLDTTTAIANLYLTFGTSLPAPNSSGFSDDTLPTCPDLSPYANPHEWPSSRKKVMLFLSCVATGLTAYTAGAYSPPADLMASEFGVSRTAVLTGVTTFTGGFALAPMILASFSEINGRYPVFVIAGIVFVVFQVVCGVVSSLAGMLIARFLTGVGSSVFSTMVGGVIADLWEKEKRNTPMALFSGSVLMGTGLGPLVSSVMVYRWEGGNTVGPGATWRWVFWHQVIADMVVVAAIVVFFHESRGSVLLSRKARKLNQWYEALEEKGFPGVWMPVQSAENGDTLISSTSDPHQPGDEEKEISAPAPLSAREMEAKGFALQRIRWLVKEDEQRTSITKMISISVFRPFHLLCTEPVVFFFSLWVSFAWAILYLTFGSIPLVFSQQYGFNTEQAGYIFIAMIVGSILATVIGVFQEDLLRHPKWQRKAATDTDEDTDKFWSFVRRKFPVEAPESRLYFTCITSILLPVGLYLFGFSSQPSSHWIAPAIAISLASMGIYYIYLATFNYLADSYQSYASSALAAQSFCRNILGGAFPLVVGPLFTNLGDRAAGGLLGAIATALTVVPWVLAFYGEKIRRRSKFAVSLEHT
ncbi:major facilitator superfamily domain-containing protein [Pseudomassariella vexata]|uniref:Major facilitator superfamily domain-containing protein n=1 Tax=Pseudomassariella vexata TaxID=1141098 RepID=A0A1Y2DER7_9PEZI|nr:major facilitator superfamily domain-containing protein [Pseudomassariella vexata]ORY57782.1 major facilitator superfamily domain-containing protein [Pseudomassariella vexata]